MHLDPVTKIIHLNPVATHDLRPVTLLQLRPLAVKIHLRPVTTLKPAYRLLHEFIVEDATPQTQLNGKDDEMKNHPRLETLIQRSSL